MFSYYRFVKTLFRRAREQKPSIIFIDEVDSWLGARTDNVSESARHFKSELAGDGNANDGVMVIGATNAPWELEPTITRLWVLLYTG